MAGVTVRCVYMLDYNDPKLVHAVRHKSLLNETLDSGRGVRRQTTSTTICSDE